MDRRELRQRVQEREEDLVQAGEAHPGLELDAGSTEDARAGGRRRLRRGVQEFRLADTGLAGHEQGSAVGPGRGKERADAVELRFAPDQMIGLASGTLPGVVPRRAGFDQWALREVHWATRDGDIAVSGPCILTPWQVTGKGSGTPNFESCDT